MVFVTAANLPLTKFCLVFKFEMVLQQRFCSNIVIPVKGVAEMKMSNVDSFYLWIKLFPEKCSENYGNLE